MMNLIIKNEVIWDLAVSKLTDYSSMSNIGYTRELISSLHDSITIAKLFQ